MHANRKVFAHGVVTFGTLLVPAYENLSGSLPNRAVDIERLVKR